MSARKPLSQSELGAFCQQLAMVVRSGLPVYYGISILRDETADKETAALLGEIYEPMEGGSTLYYALKKTGIFPSYMLHMIDFGETAGRLEEVLVSLSEYYEREAEIRDSIRHAVTYPVIMTIMMVCVILIMVTKVLPVFSRIYEELGTELTGIAKKLMTVSDILNRYTMIFVIIFAVLLLAGCILYQTEYGRLLFQGKKLSLSIASSRFANCMYLALASGLDTDQGLELSGELVNHPIIQARIAMCQKHIRHGASFDRALLESGIFSELYASWIAIGSKTGSMDECLRQIGEACEKETDEKLSHMLSMIEPALVIILCIFIGLIMISFLLPLLGIMSSIR